MSQYTFKMPDLGEGTVDAEIVVWHAKPGDMVAEDQLIVEVMTESGRAIDRAIIITPTTTNTNAMPPRQVRTKDNCRLSSVCSVMCLPRSA